MLQFLAQNLVGAVDALAQGIFAQSHAVGDLVEAWTDCEHKSVLMMTLESPFAICLLLLMADNIGYCFWSFGSASQWKLGF